MIFPYMTGMILFAVLYFVGTKIHEFIDPYPPNLPLDKEYENIMPCVVCINGKLYNCIKTTHISKTYGYNADCDVVEWENRFLKYELDNPLSEMLKFIDYKCMTLIVQDNGAEIECCMSSDSKYFISLKPKQKESIYRYRKPAILKEISTERKPTT